MDQTWTFLQGSNDRSIFRHFYGDSSRDKESFSNRGQILDLFSSPSPSPGEMGKSAVLPKSSFALP